MRQIKAEVLKNVKLSADCFLLDLRSGYIAANSKPGQFVQVRIEGKGGRPFLRRPFSIHSVKDKNTFQLLCEIVGEGTRILSGCKKGDVLDIIGPLGNGFEVNPKKNNLLAAGGMGIAPLLFLAEILKKSGAENKTLLFLGARSKDRLIAQKEFESLRIKTLVCTDDGSCGEKGFVTSLLEEFIGGNTDLKKNSLISGCGPAPMLKTLIETAKKLNAECQVSLEEMFACGVGACLGCAVKSKEGYKLVCKDGPVFRGEEVIL